MGGLRGACENKSARQRRPHRFHVSRPPYLAAGSATDLNSNKIRNVLLDIYICTKYSMYKADLSPVKLFNNKIRLAQSIIDFNIIISLCDKKFESMRAFIDAVDSSIN